MYSLGALLRLSMTSYKSYKVHDMRKLLLEAGLELSEEALAKLWLYHKLLRQANPSLNLSRIYNFENMVRKHYIDSLFVHKVLRGKAISLPSPLLDIGSGAGLPGIPLAIYLPQVDFLLAESRQLRASFLEEVITKLGLKNAKVHNHRISSLHCPPVKGAITRALEKMPPSLERLQKSLPPGGLFIFMKGPHCDHEISAVQEKSYPFKLLLDHAYTLPDSKDRRRIVVWEKSDSALSFAQNTPLVTTSVSAKLSPPLIESRSNPRFKFIYDLRKSRYIKKYKQSLICGPKLLPEFLRLYPQYAKACISPPKDMGGGVTKNIKSELEQACEDLPKIFFSLELFKELDFMGTGAPLLLIDTPSLPVWNEKEMAKGEGLFPQTSASAKKDRLALHVFLPLGNPENLGAALRSCAAFYVGAVILLQEASHPFHPKAIRAAAGHCFGLPLYSGPSLNELKNLAMAKQGLTHGEETCYALDPCGEALSELDKIGKIERRAPLRLLLGSEGQGLPSDLPWRRISVPMAPGIESLNTAVSLGIALYIISQKAKGS